MSRLQLAIEQIVFARNYTIGLLDQTPADRVVSTASGRRQPRRLAGGPHRLRRVPPGPVAIRGERPDDDALFSPDFKRLFGADSVPQADSTYPARRTPGRAGPGA